MYPQTNTSSQVQQVAYKLQSLSPQRIAEIEDFIDFLTLKDQSLILSASAVAEPSFNQVWNNPDDADYDQL